MSNVLQLTIEGFWTLEEHGEKEDGTPDVRSVEGYKIRLVRDHALILFEETLPREKVPVDPTVYLASRMAGILAPHLPGIDPRMR
jgi:hypothetical protein